MSQPADVLLRSSATELAAAIRSREVSARQVVDAHIRRAQAVHPRINALVVDRFAEARAEADEADRRVRTEPPESLPPLLGVPCSIKESFALTGMPNTSGLPSRVGKPATHDAVTVKRLRAAGAIPLGVTNTSELCMWMETANRVYGRTSNPYDPRRIVGGSSGGEGAVVGSGASPFGLGADIGGSIRMPAFFNGVFGHKPSSGLVPSSGQFPIAEGEALRLLSSGPLARRAADLELLVRILSGPDGDDPVCRPMTLAPVSAVDVSSLTVLDIPDDGHTPVSPDLRHAQRSVAEHLERLGCRVRRLRVPRLGSALEYWGSTMHLAGGTPFGVLLGDGKAVDAVREMGRFALGQSEHTLPAIGLALIEKLPALFKARARRMADDAQALRAELSELLGDDGVFLYPSYPAPAPFHHQPLLPPFRWVYTAVVNVLGFPATQVPLGLNLRGVPLGVQVVAAHGHDHLTMAVALELERAFGGWVFPPK